MRLSIRCKDKRSEDGVERRKEGRRVEAAEGMGK